jgi:hypothetical protein
VNGWTLDSASLDSKLIGFAFDYTKPIGFMSKSWQLNSTRLDERYMTHITNTLKHEMIHQWQHEVLYAPPHGKKPPKGWHNKDFKAKAEVIGIPCVGRNMCTGTNLTEIAAEQRRRLAGEEGKESGDPGEEAIPKKSRIENGNAAVVNHVRYGARRK